jgi:hypothetical protein
VVAPSTTQSAAPAVTEQPQAFGAGTPAGNSVAAPASGLPSQKSSKRTLILGIVSAVIAIAFIAGAFMLFKLSQAIKLTDVTTAQSTNDKLTDDINDISTAMSSASFSDDLKGVTSTVDTVRTKLTDAENNMIPWGNLQYCATKK